MTGPEHGGRRQIKVASERVCLSKKFGIDGKLQEGQPSILDRCNPSCRSENNFRSSRARRRASEIDPQEGDSLGGGS